MKNSYVRNDEVQISSGCKSKPMPAKRVNIVSVRLVKEASILYKNRRVESPSDGYMIFKEFLEDLDREAFIVLFLDNKNQPVSINLAHIGNINSSIVSMPCIMRTAILSNAASIMVAHNHPSGDVEPSSSDRTTTLRLVEVCELMGINFLDHLIIGDDSYVSLREEGFI